MRYLSAHAQHIGARRYQQDAFEFADTDDADFAEHGGFLAVICDGMGGMEHGDLASQSGVATLIAEYRRKLPSETIPDALLRGLREANQRVLGIASSLGVQGSMGTTLVAAVAVDGGYHFISAGDSALFHVRQGKLELVNRPHIFGNLLDRAAASGTITPEEAGAHPEREALTSFVGIEALEEIDRSERPVPLGEGETLLLATDGLFKTLSTTEIEAALTGHPQSWPAKLLAATLDKRRSGQDNITVLSVTADAPELGLWTEPAEDARPALDDANDRPPESAARAPLEEDGGIHHLSSGALIAAIVAIILLAIAAAIAGYRVGLEAGV
jgi:PPM family protein phosphatase